MAEGQQADEKRPGGRRAWRARLYLWATRRLYHELAWAYDAAAWLVSLGRWSIWRRQVLAHVRGPRVLELGPGTGHLLAEMAGRGWQVVGLEPSLQMQRVMGRTLARRGARVARLRGRAEALPFADGAFDTIVSTFPAQYILSADTFREAARVLCPGGRLVIGGLYVEVDRGLARVAARLLYGGASVPGALDRLGALAEPHGLWMSVVAQGVAGARVPVLVIERPGAAQGRSEP